MSTHETLLPCPFCGAKPKVTVRTGSPAEDYAWLAFVVCYCGGFSSCAHKDGYAGTKAKARASAIAAWNTRASPPPPEDGWVDIESAPKDGQTLIYWVSSVKYDEDEETGRLREVDVSAVDMGCWVNGGEHGEGYHDPFCGIPGDSGAPTHYMLLPKAPPPPAALEPKEQHD